MGGPITLGWLFATVFLLVTLYCLTQVALGAAGRRVRDPGEHGNRRDVDVTHVVMGLGMTAMFSPVHDPVPRPVWTAAFAAAGWFAIRMMRDWPRLRAATPGGRAWHWHHIVEPLAMVSMVWAMSAPDAMAGMSMTTSGAWDTTVATALMGYFAVFAVWSARQAARAPMRAALATSGPAPIALLLSPRLAVCCHTVMSVGMAYGFLLMM